MKPIILPEEKLDELANKVCARILNGHYFTNGVIRGEELKEFADHQQVNKFLLFQIYQTWNLQLSKLKHAYFDFSHPEVEQGLKNLRNLLSRHIQISEDDFQPLLKRAVYNNIKLLLNPKESFESFFFVDSDQISLQSFSQYAPFFSDMDFIVNSILRYHQKHQLEDVEKGMFFLKMDKVIDLYNQKSNTPFENYQKETLNKLLKEDIDDIIRELEKDSMPTESPVQEEPPVEEPAVSFETQAEVPTQPPVQEESNFFETVISGGNATNFDFSDDIDLEASGIEPETPAPTIAEQYIPPVTPEPQNPPAYTPPPVEETPAAPVYTPPVEPVEEEPVAPIQQHTPPVEHTPEENPSEPSTVEEALSAFLNKSTPSKSVFDSLNDKPEENAEPTYTPPSFEAPEPPQRTVPTPPVFNQYKEEANGEYTSNIPQFSSPPVGEVAPDQPKTIAEKYQATTSSTPPPANGVGKEIKLSDIPIHRQYQYVQKVFDGNNVRFRIIVDKVNNSKNRDEVESIIDRFILSNSGLNKSDEVVQEFIKMLRGRH